MSWTSADGLSGPTHVYTVSVMTPANGARGRADTGPLQLWLAGTTAFSANFAGQLGHKYTFVVTTTDNVRNTSQGTATTDAIQVTKYYYIGSPRVAMRRSAPTGTAVTYLHTDHLGTVSVATTASGQEMARTLHRPYGSVRWSSGAMPTDYGFTGMKDTGLGLVYLHARYYSSWVGRFVSADTIVPEPGYSQAFNKFSYTYNNPLKYIDPTGHEGCSPDDIAACEGHEDELLKLLGNQLEYLDERWRTGFLRYWISLLGHTPTGSTLIQSLLDAGLSISVGFDATSLTDKGDTVTMEGGFWAVKIKYDWFTKDLLKLLTRTGTEAKHSGLKEYNAYYAGVIGHELFHVAIGDADGSRMVGDGDWRRPTADLTSIAYRINGKIVNEILYDGALDKYRPHSDITGSDLDGNWNYPQANHGFRGAILFNQQFEVNSGFFRVRDPNVIRALISVGVPDLPSKPGR